MYIDVLKVKKMLVFASALLFFSYSVSTAIYYIAYPSAAFFHADCSDTILWAQASYDSGTMFNPDFGYAAMLPFGGTTLMLPFIGIFGVSFTTHRIGMILFTVILFVSVLWLCRCIKMSLPLSFTATGTFALVMCSSAKLREIFYEHVIYYSICVLIICVLLSLFIKFRESFERENGLKKLVAATFFTVIFSALSALDGMQVVATGILPVLFAAVMGIFLDKNNTLLSKKSRVSVYYCVICGASAFIGLVLLSFFADGISSGYAGAYSGYANMDEWLSNLGNFPVHWFTLFGVDAHYGMPIFSAESIVNIIRIGSAAAVALVPIIALFFYNKFRFGTKALLLAHFGLSGVIMFGYVFGILSAANWRLSPMICTGLLCCFAVFAQVKGYFVPRRICALVICLLLLLSAVNFGTVMQMEKNGIEQNEKYLISQQLKEKGLTYGYATFWNSQVITVLSDSEVRAANIDVNENGIAPCPYQANLEWFEEQEGIDKYFVLLSYGEEETLMNTTDWVYFELLHKEKIDLDGYTVYVFNSTDFLY